MPTNLKFKDVYLASTPREKNSFFSDALLAMFKGMQRGDLLIQDEEEQTETARSDCRWHGAERRR